MLHEWLEREWGVEVLQTIPVEEHGIIAKLDREKVEKIGRVLKIPVVNPSDQREFRPSNLGLHIEIRSFDEGLLRVFYYVGCSWVKVNKDYALLKVIPKGERLDFLERMLKGIWSDDVVRKEFLKRFNELIWFSLEGRPIPVDVEDKSYFLLFTVLTFVFLVESIVKRGLKFDYVGRMEVGLKGKILIKETWNKFHSKGIFFKSFCRETILSKDSSENRIIKFVLLKLLKMVESSQFFQKILSADRILYLLSFFKDVSTITHLNYKRPFFQFPSRFFKEYSLAIKLAFLVLEGLGLSVFPIRRSFKNTIIPHAINMPMLYELYVWSEFGKKYNFEKVYYQKQIGSVRPDFLVKTNGDEWIILEVKYKFDPSPDVIDRDEKQLNHYGSSHVIRHLCGGKEPKKVLIYPSISSIDEKKRKELRREFGIELVEIPGL